MTAGWPASLPQTLDTDGFTETVGATCLRTSMDVGPAKVRRRTTAEVRTVSGSLIFDAAQLETFDTFYAVTLSGGALPFTFAGARGGVTHTYRVTAEPKYSPLGGGWWKTTLSLERLPS